MARTDAIVLGAGIVGTSIAQCGAGYRQFDLVDLYPEPAGYAVFAGDQGQTAAGVTGRPLRVRWGRGLAGGRFSGT